MRHQRSSASGDHSTGSGPDHEIGGRLGPRAAAETRSSWSKAVETILLTGLRTAGRRGESQRHPRAWLRPPGGRAQGLMSRQPAVPGIHFSPEMEEGPAPGGVGPSWVTPFWGGCVRRCPTLPHPLGCSTIGAARLSFRVRNGTGRFPCAMTTETFFGCLSLPCGWGDSNVFVGSDIV